MSYSFGKASSRRLATCHRDIFMIVNVVITRTPVDFTVADGRRGRVAQEAAFEAGNSKARYGESPHNAAPLSLAVDLVPYIDGRLAYENDEAFDQLHDCVREVEGELLSDDVITNRLDWGGDWSGFVDKPHWQIRGWRKMVKEAA